MLTTSAICFLYGGQRSEVVACFPTEDFLVNNGDRGETLAVSSVGQAVSDSQQGYNVGGGAVALVAPETEPGTTTVWVIAFWPLAA